MLSLELLYESLKTILVLFVAKLHHDEGLILCLTIDDVGIVREGETIGFSVDGSLKDNLFADVQMLQRGVAIGVACGIWPIIMMMLLLL